MMKKLSGAAAVLAALMMLFVAGCEQASGGGEETPPAGEPIKLAGTNWKVVKDANNSASGMVSTAEFADTTWIVYAVDGSTELATGGYIDDVKTGTPFSVTVKSVSLNGALLPDADKLSATITVNTAESLTVEIDLSSMSLGTLTFDFTRG